LTLVEDFQRSADQHSALNAFTYLATDSLTQETETALSGPLSGMLVGVKDNIAVRDMPLTCASEILRDYISPYDATAVSHLKESGALIVGKTNLDEFAMGSSSEFSIFGPVRNPVNPDYVAGGSSGGSTAAVAAGLVDVALGTDTGGSVRQPASYCGIVGLKPTYGRVSRYGLVAFASSLDQIGILSRNVTDAARMLTVIAGADPSDATSVDHPVPSYAAKLETDPENLCVGVPQEYFAEGIQPEVKAHVDRIVDELRSMGVKVKTVSIPHTPSAIAIYYIISSAEASSNLARYDGVRYGSRQPNEDLQKMYTDTREHGFGPEVKRRIMLGTYVLSAGYYEAYYGKAQKVRRLLKQNFDRVFQEVDALITPTAPTTAFRQGEKLDDPLAMYLNDIYTASVNLAGLPAMSIPAGVDRKDLPIGCQLIAPPFEEETILQLGTIIERLEW